MLQVAEPEPAPGLANRDAVHAELAELGPEIARERVAAVDLLGARRNMCGREAAHALAQHVRRLTEPEIEPTETACQHGDGPFVESGSGGESGRTRAVLQSGGGAPGPLKTLS